MLTSAYDYQNSFDQCYSGKLEAQSCSGPDWTTSVWKTALALEFVPADSLNYFDLEDPTSLIRLEEPLTALPIRLYRSCNHHWGGEFSPSKVGIFIMSLTITAVPLQILADPIAGPVSIIGQQGSGSDGSDP